MKRTTGKTTSNNVVALALTWDGARWPVRSLPARARAFLSGKSHRAPLPSAGQLSALFANDQINEVRVCWVPQLKGGDEVLAGPFTTSTGKRIPFKATRKVRFGDILGVAYRRL